MERSGKCSQRLNQIARKLDQFACRNANGTLWIGTLDSGLVKMVDTVMTIYNTRNSIMRDNGIQSLAVAPTARCGPEPTSKRQWAVRIDTREMVGIFSPQCRRRRRANGFCNPSDGTSGPDVNHFTRQGRPTPLRRGRRGGGLRPAGRRTNHGSPVRPAGVRSK